MSLFSLVLEHNTRDKWGIAVCKRLTTAVCFMILKCYQLDLTWIYVFSLLKILNSRIISWAWCPWFQALQHIIDLNVPNLAILFIYFPQPWAILVRSVHLVHNYSLCNNWHLCNIWYFLYNLYIYLFPCKSLCCYCGCMLIFMLLFFVEYT